MHESLRLWAVCNAMKWNHLPVAGGIYDQHPEFLDDIMVVFDEKWKADKRESDRQKNESKKGKRGR